METTHTFVACFACKLSWDSLEDAAAQGHTFQTARPHRLIARVVRGTFSTEVTCTSSCVNARGSDCECACGGKDHGRFAA